MSTVLFVPGPALIYVGTGAAKAFQFLGWMTSGVRLTLQAEFEDVMADFGGTRIPVDSTFQGEQGYVAGDLSKYNEGIMSILSARTASAASITGGALAGLMPAAGTGAGIGTLMVSEGAAIPLCIVAPNQAAKTFFSAMLPCFTFSQAWLDSSYDQTWNATVKNPRVSFRCLPSWNGAGTTATLYTNILPGSLPTPA